MKDKEFQEIDAMLQEKYPILKRPHFDEKYHRFNNEYTIYQNWGFEGLSVVWLKQLIEPMMEEIYKCYEKRGETPKLIVEQIKEKWSVLKFYYSLDADHRQAIHGIDAIGGSGIRLYPEGEDEDSLAYEIASIVRKYEQLSREICIWCGAKGETRPLRWRLVLCDSCYSKVLEKESAKPNVRR